MYDTQVLALLRTHFKDEARLVEPRPAPMYYFRHSEDIPGQRHPPGYHASLAMKDAWYDHELQTIREKMGQQLMPSWVHRRRKIVEKRT